MAANSLQPTPQRRFSFRQLKGDVRRRKSLVVAKRMPTPCSAPNPETPRPLVLAFGGLVALASAVGIGRFVYTPILPLMVEDLSMTKGAAGLLASANFLGYLAGAMLAATPTMPGSRRSWLLLALIVSSLTTSAMAFASSTAAFLTLRFTG